MMQSPQMEEAREEQGTMTSRIRRRQRPSIPTWEHAHNHRSVKTKSALSLLLLCLLVPNAVALETRQLLDGNIFDQTEKSTGIATKNANSVGFLDPAFHDNGLLLDDGDGGNYNKQVADNDSESDAEVVFDEENVIVLDYQTRTDPWSNENETLSESWGNETETGMEENVTATDLDFDSDIESVIDNDSNSTVANATNGGQGNETSTESSFSMDDEMANATDTDTDNQSNSTGSSPADNSTTIAPTNEDGSTTTSAPATVVTINSSFVVTTPAASWTEDSDLLQAAPQEQIETLASAFGALARIVVMDLNTKIMESNNNTVVRGYSYLRSRRRQLQSSALGYYPETATIIGLRPTTAPCLNNTQLNGSICLTAYAQYNVSVEDDNEYLNVYDTLVTDTQTAIDQGGLQEELVAIDPDSIFTVQAAAEPVVLPPPQLPATTTTEPTFPPETQPPAPETKNNDTVMIILIVLFTITAIVVALLLALYFYLKRTDEEEINEKNTDEDEAGYNSDPEQAPILESYLDDEAGAGGKGVSNPEEESSHMFVSPSTDFAQHENNYKQRVEELVAEHCPEETPNIAAILEQFKGREEALIATLQHMEEVERELDGSNSHSDDESDEEIPLPAVDRQDANEEEKDEIEHDAASRDETTSSRASETGDETMGKI